ncbi:NUDIX hydrolase [Streptomyces klenkii]|uniref:NUDIX hydrolase n=1 Tax=Streptomyces klenkii TaxID=1420899 RepID=UPI00340CA889
MTETEQDRRPARPRMAAGALFFNAKGHVLFVRPSYKPKWEIPGGYIEEGESPRAACRREVEEELGITPPIGSLLVVDWAPNEAEGDKVLYIFDGGELKLETMDKIKFADGELLAAEFHPVESVDQLLIPRLARRVRQAVLARDGAHLRYLEHGEPLA